MFHRDVTCSVWLSKQSRWWPFSLCLCFKIVLMYNYGGVVGCTSRWVDSSLSFYRFPKEEKQLVECDQA